tara:strand:+ start:148 stop:765 length:618 start_codon:yes stop_codon:yes gene_type:complete
MERRMKYLWDNEVVYRRDPTTDVPDVETKQYMFFKNGTHQCYDLFRSKAKITSYRSLYWHMLVLWYLNPEWEDGDAYQILIFLMDKNNGFTTFSLNKWNMKKLIYELSVLDKDEPPRNKIRKVIFKDFSGLSKSEKLSIVGQLIGRSSITKEDIYETMLYKNNCNEKITISWLAETLKVTPRTIHRRMCQELKQVKTELNEEINI